MQGIAEFIPTNYKVEYLNSLLKVGFQALDCGSFVSPKSIPQMEDTHLVIPRLDLSNTDTKLSVIVANRRGADEASEFDEISYLGFPFSVSETFQKKNTNASIETAVERVEEIMNIAQCHNKEFVLYLSMAFGNPYDDMYDIAIVEHWVDVMQELGVRRMSISDTIGAAKPKVIDELLNLLIMDYPKVKFGCHFHSRPETWKEKVEAAWEAGCTRFDGAINGYGGCPMASDKLTGNLATENLLHFFEEKGIDHGLNKDAFFESMAIAARIFPH